MIFKSSPLKVSSLRFNLLVCMSTVAPVPGLVRSLGRTKLLTSQALGQLLPPCLSHLFFSRLTILDSISLPIQPLCLSCSPWPHRLIITLLSATLGRILPSLPLASAVLTAHLIALLLTLYSQSLPFPRPPALSIPHPFTNYLSCPQSTVMPDSASVPVIPPASHPRGRDAVSSFPNNVVNLDPSKYMWMKSNSNYTLCHKAPPHVEPTRPAPFSGSSGI
jgi:hypothetical protein